MRGVAEGRALAYKGIPYAQAPVGPLRWKPPVAAARWDGVRDGGRYGAMRLQIKLIVEKRHPAMPVIIGTTSGETGPWADTAGRITDESSYAAAIDKVFGAAARERILAVYPASAYSSPRAAFAQVTTDAEFTCQSRRVARVFARAQREPVYRYLFNHPLDNDPALKALGANHTIEHPFLFA